MKNYTLVMILFYMLVTFEQSDAQVRKFGLGVIVGEPTGLSAKLWTTNTNALDFGLGWSLGGSRIAGYNGYYNSPDRIHFHMDYLWHSFDAIRSSERFPLYYGVGGRFTSGAGYDNSVAVRGVFGIAWLPHNTPLDVFLELVPSLQLVSSSAFGLDAGFGVRVFF